jgi:hypothetical protein
MKIHPSANEHPAARQECLAVAGSGSLEHVHAISAFSVAFDSLFDGATDPADEIAAKVLALRRAKARAVDV